MIVLRCKLAPEAAADPQATLSAMQSDIDIWVRRIKDCIANAAELPRLRDRGKPAKVAIVAVVRQLITLVNALLRGDRTWQPQPPFAGA